MCTDRVMAMRYPLPPGEFLIQKFGLHSENRLSGRRGILSLGFREGPRGMDAQARRSDDDAGQVSVLHTVVRGTFRPPPHPSPSTREEDALDGGFMPQPATGTGRAPPPRTSTPGKGGGGGGGSSSLHGRGPSLGTSSASSRDSSTPPTHINAPHRPPAPPPRSFLPSQNDGSSTPAGPDPNRAHTSPPYPMQHPPRRKLGREEMNRELARRREEREAQYSHRVAHDVSETASIDSEDPIWNPPPPKARARSDFFSNPKT
jgi:hypothetical protein